LSTLARELPGMAVFSDASMIGGIRNSRAEKYIFRHKDPRDLAAARPSRPRPAEAGALRVGLFGTTAAALGPCIARPCSSLICLLFRRSASAIVNRKKVRDFFALLV
jgi:hypothetical protein